MGDSYACPSFFMYMIGEIPRRGSEVLTFRKVYDIIGICKKTPKHLLKLSLYIVGLSVILLIVEVKFIVQLIRRIKLMGFLFLYL